MGSVREAPAPPEGVKKFPSWVRRGAEGRLAFKGWSMVQIRFHRGLHTTLTAPEALAGFVPS